MLFRSEHHSARGRSSSVTPVWLLLVWLLGAAMGAVPPAPAYAAESRSTIGGTVYLDEKRDGNPTGDRRLRGVEVRLVGVGRNANAQTNQKGDYNFEGLAAGTYEVSVVPPSGQESTTALPLRVTVDGKNSNQVIDFGLAPARGVPSPGPLTHPSITSGQGASASPSPTPTVTPTRSPTPTAVPGPIASPPKIGRASCRERV